MIWEKKPTTNHSIERVDNNKGYSPDNCVWATRKQQSRNKRTRVDEVVFNGETQTEASLRLTNGEGRRIVDKRIKELGWDIERAFTTLKGVAYQNNKSNVRRSYSISIILDYIRTNYKLYRK